MNFVGHAVVAGRQRSLDAYAFGAMVPDLRRLVRSTPIDVDDPALDAGVASHHRIDAAFHELAWFKGSMATVVDAMPVADRGARAAAHVAVELAIDGVLLRRGAPAYDAALRWGASSLDGPWRDVVARIASGAIVDAYTSAAGIADRVVSVMERRPRLRPIAPDRGDLARAVDVVLPIVERDVDAVLGELSPS